jgi:hypothetical protein
MAGVWRGIANALRTCLFFFSFFLSFFVLFICTHLKAYERARSALLQGGLQDPTPTRTSSAIIYYIEICALEDFGERPDLQPLHVVERPGRTPHLVLDLNDLTGAHEFRHH